jgi:hypothetical protein
MTKKPVDVKAPRVFFTTPVLDVDFLEKNGLKEIKKGSENKERVGPIQSGLTN